MPLPRFRLRTLMIAVAVVAAVLAGYFTSVEAGRRSLVGPEYRALVTVRRDDSEPTGARLRYAWYDVNTRVGAKGLFEAEARLRATGQRYYVVRGRMMVLDQAPPGRPESADFSP